MSYLASDSIPMSKISKKRHFRLSAICLSLAVTEIRPLPIWGNFWDFSSKIGHFTFGAESLLFAVIEIQLFAFERILLIFRQK
jgi:hypothetical protein